MGWRATIGLEDGIRATYPDFLSRYAALAQPVAVA
jgi:GDP-L-fucose synthase